MVLALTYVTLFEDKVKAIMNEGLPHYTLRSKLYLGVLCWLLIFIPVINTLFAYYMLKINIGKVKFELDEEGEMHATDSIYDDDVKLMGPFLLDLIDLNKILS